MSRRRAAFVISADKPAGFPAPELPELAIVGRSNVGKSSLINAVTGQHGLARTSRTPGRTRLLNWFRVDSGPTAFHLVDLPGYGYAEVHRDMRASWQPLIEAYLGKRDVLAGVVMLIDIRRGVQAEELDLAAWLAEHEVPHVCVLTKADKLSKHEREVVRLAAKRSMPNAEAPLVCSAQSNEGIDMVWRAMFGMVAR